MNITSGPNAGPGATTAGRILVDRQGHTATVTIANEGKRNALTVQMWDTLRDTFQAFAADGALRCVIVRGQGTEGFAAGADISEFATVRSTREQVTAFHEQTVRDALGAIHDCPVPVVALIQGACAGGGLEIASVCDLRIAGHSARLGIPIRMLGFSLALAEMQWLVRLVGPAVAAELLYEGRMLDAQEALAKGLLTRVVPDAEVEADAMAAAARIAEGAPLAARAHKRLLRRLAADPSPATRAERLDSYAFADTEDYRIGVQAFLGKRHPVFVGR
jgi:enoyl-CoA hydratase/carnithine racemase